MDNTFHSSKTEPLAGYDLVYPGEAICLSPSPTAISNDGASISLHQFASLPYHLQDLLANTSSASCHPPGRVAQFGRDADSLLVNGKEKAFPESKAKFVYVKIQVPSGRSQGRRKRNGRGKGFGPARYVYVPTAASVGRLCYRIAMEYKSLLEVVQPKKRESGRVTECLQDFRTAVLYEIALTKETRDKLPVWVARVRHDSIP
ncbi:hypothetical protein NMY22_g17278 [Coprinellus aureogranulatus]|nr:hypothetical protein NMY22_g17278 [Coprinellus aureogranulatus]